MENPREAWLSLAVVGIPLLAVRSKSSEQTKLVMKTIEMSRDDNDDESTTTMTTIMMTTQMMMITTITTIRRRQQQR